MLQVTEVVENMLNTVRTIFTEVNLIVGPVVGMCLTAIGYEPGGTVQFLLTLVLLDLITKHYSLTVQHMSEFTIYSYIKTWQDRVITSRKLRQGTLSKLLIYISLFYIVEQVSNLPDMSSIALVSNSVYVMIALTEISSVLENMRDCNRGIPVVDALLDLISKANKNTIPNDVSNITTKKEGTK